VHHGSETFQIIQFALESVGARLIYLPAYSPELNPCELVFSFIKSNIRKEPAKNIPIWARVLQALSLVHIQMIINFYNHCIFPKYILPEL
jgi:transposase